ncbi:hypothetical protein Aperf_G00000012003 [Anoplocephala perfoliata]
MSSTDLLPTIGNITNATELPEYCVVSYVSGFLHILVTHVSLSIALLGIPANILALIVLNYSVTNRSPTNFLLTALAAEDILIIIFYSAYYIAIHYYEAYDLEWLGNLRYFDTPLFYLVNWTKMVEIYTVVFLSLERYVAIRWPLKASRLCSFGRTRRGLCVIIVLSGIVKLPNLIFDYRLLKWNTACRSYRLEPIFASAAWYPTFKLVYVQLLDQVCSFVIPLSLLIFLNFSLILRIRRFSNRHVHGQWSGGNGPCSDISANNNICGSDTSQNTLNTITFKEKTSVKRSLTLKASFRLRRNPEEKTSHSKEHDSSVKEQLIRRPNTITKSAGSAGQTGGTLQRSMSSNSQSILLTLVGVVTIFIICETPTTVCFLFEMATLIYASYTRNEDELKGVENSFILVTSNNLYYYAYPAALVLVLVGCASNFFIYMLIGRRFRRNCRQLFVSMAHRICCWKDKTKNATDYGFIRPLKHLRRSKVKKSNLALSSGHPVRRM